MCERGLVQTGCTAPQFKLAGIVACGRDSMACMLPPGDAALIAPEVAIAPALADGSLLALEF
ncbi:MAG TPA: hypothetical protein VMG98_01550 [Verrucomicrobiae bacterium]|nr:hypothetical protein [Verrucomicrobiae bacterium]